MAEAAMQDEILSPAGSNDWTAFRVQKKVSKVRKR
jgi:hypothetical protein